MDEEQQYESFHMDKDFEGLVEVGGEFMFRWDVAVLPAVYVADTCRLVWSVPLPL
jgi:hypothetical protein